MKFFLVDDSPSIRAMLETIIFEEELGEVVAEREDGADVHIDDLITSKADILVIDLLMPNKNGIDTVKDVHPFFNGKIVMLSQVESKEMIGAAYDQGIDYYITKPINRSEVVNIFSKISEQILLERSLQNIRDSLNILEKTSSTVEPSQSANTFQSGKRILMDLGIYHDKGAKDLLEIIVKIDNSYKNDSSIPPLKDLYQQIILDKKTDITEADLKKEIKACEQRIRRVIQAALHHVASIGLVDITNPKFEHLAMTFFDYEQIRKTMHEIEVDKVTPSKINVKKFITSLYFESTQ